MTAKLSGLAWLMQLIKVLKYFLFDHIEKRLCAKDLFSTFCKTLDARKCFQTKPPDGEGRIKHREYDIRKELMQNSKHFQYYNKSFKFISKHFKQGIDHFSHSILDFVEFSIIHEGRRSYQFMLLIHMDL